MPKKFGWIIGAYIAGFIITFGQAYHECPGCLFRNNNERITTAGNAAFLWPVYWPLRASVELWRAA